MRTPPLDRHSLTSSQGPPNPLVDQDHLPDSGDPNPLIVSQIPPDPAQPTLSEEFLNTGDPTLAPTPLIPQQATALPTQTVPTQTQTHTPQTLLTIAPPLRSPNPPAPKVPTPGDDEKCPICKSDAPLNCCVQCTSCKRWIHSLCTRMPDYLILTFMKTTRAYSCERCGISKYSVNNDILLNIRANKDELRSYFQTLSSAHEEDSTQKNCAPEPD